MKKQEKADLFTWEDVIEDINETQKNSEEQYLSKLKIISFYKGSYNPTYQNFPKDLKNIKNYKIAYNHFLNIGDKIFKYIDNINNINTGASQDIIVYNFKSVFFDKDNFYFTNKLLSYYNSITR